MSDRQSPVGTAPQPGAEFSVTPDDPSLQRQWDVIVVGTGMGGATIGHRLAQSGLAVLFCELGTSAEGTDAWRGMYPEMADGRTGTVLCAADARQLLRAGRCADTLVDESRRRTRSFIPLIGSGPGGSSALYGMALERFMPTDFAYDERPGDPPPADALATPWPISYADLAPYYAQAEALYGVRGTRDPVAAASLASASLPALSALPAPPPLSAAGAEMASFLTQRGLHPYRLPGACEYVASCASCQGYLCKQDCKNGADRVCLRPALRQHGARLLSGCRVLSVTTAGRRATGVRCRVAGREFELRSRAVVLAAGALQSPLILLRSTDGSRISGGPGLGNASGLVGRCLMRHLIDLYLVRPRGVGGEPFDNRRKEIACNDFYSDDGVRLGTFQSFGRLPPAPMLWGSLVDDLGASPWAWTAPAVRLARPAVTPLLRDMVERRWAFATIAEDLPYADNRIELHPRGAEYASLRYRLRPEGLQRAARFRDRIATTLKGRSWQRLPQAANNQRIAHACGTCRFGDDPGTSVLDRDNRLHDADNVFIVDSSFFPSSGGTNPSLTIAANALRVGGLVADHLL